METNVTIISNNLNRGLLNNYKDYKVIDKSFKYEELALYKKVIFFNVLRDLSKEEINKLYDYLKTNKIMFINVTNNIEEVLFTDKLVVYDRDKILLEGLTIDVLKNEKLLKRLGFKLPFMVELSLLLKDYNLVDDIYLDKKELESVLWK